MAELTLTQATARIIVAFAFGRERIIRVLIDGPTTEPYMQVYEPTKFAVPVGPADMEAVMQETVDAWLFKAQRLGGYENSEGSYQLWRIVADAGRHGDVVVWTGLRRRY